MEISLRRSNGPGDGGDLISPKGLIDPGKSGYQEGKKFRRGMTENFPIFALKQVFFSP